MNRRQMQERVDVRYIPVPNRERTIEPDPASKEGIKYREARSLMDNYQSMLAQRQMQYPEYYVNVPTLPEHANRIKWWVATVPFIAPVDIMSSGGAINVVRDAPAFQNDYAGTYDISDIMKTDMPLDQTMRYNPVIRNDINRNNRARAERIVKTRNPVYRDTLDRFINKVAKLDEMPTFQSQLLTTDMAQKNNKIIAQFQNIFDPHLRKSGPKN